MEMFSKIMFIIIVILFLTSCIGSTYEYEEVDINNMNRAGSYQIICIDGIEYVKILDGLSGHFKSDGSLYTCDKNESK
jgi:hypothetical protein